MSNGLARSTSPYLRQHAENPVEWYEWGAEAFAEARRRDVPLLLSVGYSACHWCHVMAHESFEDPVTAAVMNEHFVNIKVDREERPDVDSIYMSATQAMTGQGGWPMTVWIDHDGAPFHAGTYFPPEDRHGMPAFRRVMGAVVDAWQNRRDEVGEQSRALVERLEKTIPSRPVDTGLDTVRNAVELILSETDEFHGGFGGAPKFPQAPVLDVLLRVAGEDWGERARTILVTTLTAMGRGGIRDHLGGGFARYTVDAAWQVPHFEKMLYDNAQLARLYLWAWRETSFEEFRTIAEDTLAYLVTDLRDEMGGFFSAEDADSEGEEGRFYVWDYQELSGLVAKDDLPILESHWGITPGGNFEGQNILHVEQSPEQVAESLGLKVEHVDEVIQSNRAILLAKRADRVRPGLDNKIVASWNGMALRVFAEAGVVLERQDLIDTAVACATFLDNTMIENGRVLRNWTDGHGGVSGFLEDHASIALGMYATYAATGDVRWWRIATAIVDRMVEHFVDPSGGFFTTADDAETLVTRPKDQMDNPHPSGNSMAAEALLQSSAYTANGDHLDLAVSTINVSGVLIERYPAAVGTLLGVVHSLAKGTREVAVTGPVPDPLTRVFWSRYRPHMTLAVDREGSGQSEVPLLTERFDNETTRAFVCTGSVCDAPVTTPDELATTLGDGARPSLV